MPTPTTTKTKRIKKQPKPKPKPQERVEGVLLSRVDADVLRAEYRTAAKNAEQRGFDGKTAPRVSDLDKEEVPTLVRKLAAYFLATSTDIVGCTECGGDSDGGLDACPFCGEEGVVDKAEDVGGGAAAAGNIDVPESPEPEPETPVETPTAIVVPKPQAISANRAGNAGLLTETDLDAAVERVQRLHADTTRNAWELAHAVKRILDHDLWKLRKNEGKVVHRTFKQFVETELGISYMQAFRLAKVADAYPKELVEKVGTTKLYLLLQAPVEKRDKLLEDAKQGASSAQLSAAARSTEAAERITAPEDGSLTVAMAPGVRTLELQKRPVTQIATAKTEPAKSVADGPWGVELLPNGVIVRYNVIQHPKDGRLLLRIERRRAKKGEVFADEPE